MVTLMRVVSFTSLTIILCFLTVIAAAQPKDLKTVRDDKQSDGYVGVALVIGNSAYKYATPLTSPVNDAYDMGTALSNLGFKVLKVRTNAALDEMDEALVNFQNELAANKGVGVFYYSGHGVQLKGENYLIPVEANVISEATLKRNSFEVSSLLESMEAATDNAKIVILDACRNNPFEKTWRVKGSLEKGLAKVDAPEGMLIAFATSPKKTAADGTGRNSPYTEVLLKEIVSPNLSVTDMFQNVRTNLAAKTGKGQISWENTSLLGRFCFAGCNVPANTTITDTTTNNEECADCIKQGPKVSKSTVYTMNNNSFRLYAAILDNGHIDSIESEIKKFVAKSETHEWDNKWYYMTVPKQTDGLLLLWKNITTGQYGWVFLRRNNTNDWFYKTNASDYVFLPIGKEEFNAWLKTPVKIYFRAPNQVGGWTKEDIQYKFGY